MLTRLEAQQLVLTRLRTGNDARELLVVDDRTVERPFGWLFFVVVAGSNTTMQAEAGSQQLIIVNKYVEQVIESSIDYPPERFIQIYETLLAERQAGGEDWCLTASFPFLWSPFRKRRLAKKAKELGLREVR
jgi:hypothetical protein